MKRKSVFILGAGLSGLSVAFFLDKKGVEAHIFEKENEYGGLCRSHKKGGFTFDLSGHLLHFRNHKILSLVKGLLGNNLVRHKRNAFIFSSHRFIPYPFQVNFHKLPPKIAKRCLSGFIEAHNNGNLSKRNSNFLNWVNSKFGKGIARYFMIPYNEKFWRTPLENLTSEWAERFIVVPSLKDMMSSFYYNKKDNNPGYNAFFWYPQKGGIEELVKTFAHPINKNINLNCSAVEIDLDKKEVRFKNGYKERFDILISTIPLPELGKIIKDLPEELSSEFKKLRWLSIYNINLGIKGKIKHNYHWIYFPRKDIPFFRIGFFSNFSPSLVPSGKSSLYVEISYTHGKPIDKKNIAVEVKQYFKKTGILKKDNQVCCKNINDIKYGYPIYDAYYRNARETIIKHLASKNIFLCGRFGSWQYLSMEDVIYHSEKIAAFVSSRFKTNFTI
jgi:protoporphyrinogen oxidase